eukprot:TRINITY_DN1458_c0_g1_i1.p1 TRINITY_DN1458_c0_g1~~TRINITY_DN1458_c0_g1_i1.p1  ORF type:complete len:260 (-),score=64.30 TRINITY_DN1458_c0_g1_i1:48-827(-)
MKNVLYSIDRVFAINWMRMQQPLFAAQIALSMTLDDIPHYLAAEENGQPAPRLSFSMPDEVLQNAMEMQKMFSAPEEDSDFPDEAAKSREKKKKRKRSRKAEREHDVGQTEEEDDDAAQPTEYAPEPDRDETIEDDDEGGEAEPAPKRKKHKSSHKKRSRERAQLPMTKERRGRGRVWSEAETQMFLDHLEKVEDGADLSWANLLADLRKSAPKNFADRDGCSLKDKARNIKSLMIRQGRTDELGPWADRVNVKVKGYD